MSLENLGKSAGFNLEVNNSFPDQPTPNEILSLKLLKDTNEAVFKPLYEQQTKFLSLARILLVKDPWLRAKFNGDGLESMSALAKVLKNRQNELNMRNRIDKLVSFDLTQVLDGSGLKPPDLSKITALNDGKQTGGPSDKGKWTVDPTTLKSGNPIVFKS